jgi:hypothetical protein
MKFSAGEGEGANGACQQPADAKKKKRTNRERNNNNNNRNSAGGKCEKENKSQK